MFRSLLVDNAFRYLFSPLLGAFGGLVGWALFVAFLGQLENSSDMAERISYFAFMGLAVGFACNLLRGIQDGQGALRVLGAGTVAGVVGCVGGLLGGLAIHFLAEMAGSTMDSWLPKLAAYLLVGTLVGLSSRITSLDRFTWLAAVGGFLGGLFAIVIWFLLDSFGEKTDAYVTLLIPMTLGFGIGAATYSLPSFVSGGMLTVLTGQFKGQNKAIEDSDITIGNNKRQLQWVLPKWEGIQDPHAKIEVKKEGKGYKHFIRNMSAKTVVVVREGKKHKVATKQALDLLDEDVIVLATGKSFVKVQYSQKTSKE